MTDASPGAARLAPKPQARLAACAVLLLSLAPSVARAEGLVLGGAQFATRAPYGYLGTIIALPGQRLGDGWVQRYWVDALRYEYDGGPGRVEAKAWGVEAMLGVQSSTARSHAAGYLGLRAQNTLLSPFDPGNRAEGRRTGLKLQIEGEQAIARSWRVNGIANYSTATYDYWTRGRLLHGLAGGTYLGPELIVQGNRDYNLRAVGLVFGGLKPPGSALSLSVKAGYQDTKTGGGAYGGIEFAYPY